MTILCLKIVFQKYDCVCNILICFVFSIFFKNLREAEKFGDKSYFIVCLVFGLKGLAGQSEEHGGEDLKKREKKVRKKNK